MVDVFMHVMAWYTARPMIDTPVADPCLTHGPSAGFRVLVVICTHLAPAVSAEKEGLLLAPSNTCLKPSAIKEFACYSMSSGRRTCRTRSLAFRAAVPAPWRGSSIHPVRWAGAPRGRAGDSHRELGLVRLRLVSAWRHHWVVPVRGPTACHRASPFGV